MEYNLELWCDVAEKEQEQNKVIVQADRLQALHTQCRVKVQTHERNGWVHSQIIRIWVVASLPLSKIFPAPQSLVCLPYPGFTHNLCWIICVSHVIHVLWLSLCAHPAALAFGSQSWFQWFNICIDLAWTLSCHCLPSLKSCLLAICVNIEFKLLQSVSLSWQTGSRVLWK